MTKPRPEPLLDVARGDAARSHVLRESLKILRDRSGDPALDMSEEERERLAADGEHRLNRLRDELGKPASPDDDDDEDFGDAGYLQPSR